MTLVRLKLNMLEVEETMMAEQICDVNELVEKTIVELRSLSKSLDGDCVKNLGWSRVSHMRTAYSLHGEVRNRYFYGGEAYRSEVQKKIVLFRVVQEVVAVIFNRAKVSHLTVKINYESAPLKIVVESDGQEMPEEVDEKLRNFEWHDIQRRIKLIGGKCSFENKMNGGTKVNIEKKF
jgi:two-component system NarL family sensor kinase